MEQEAIISALKVTNGFERVWNADNIAIVVLMLCLWFSCIFNILQARWRNADTKEFLSKFVDVKDALHSVAISINTLNERIGHD